MPLAPAAAASCVSPTKMLLARAWRAQQLAVRTRGTRALWRINTYQQLVHIILTSPPRQIYQTLKQACAQGCPKRTVHIHGPNGSRNSATHNAYRSSLRPSPLLKPGHPPLNVVCEKWTALMHRNAGKKAPGQGTGDRAWQGAADAQPRQTPPTLRSCLGQPLSCLLYTSPSPRD